MSAGKNVQLRTVYVYIGI